MGAAKAPIGLRLVGKPIVDQGNAAAALGFLQIDGNPAGRIVEIGGLESLLEPTRWLHSRDLAAGEKPLTIVGEEAPPAAHSHLGFQDGVKIIGKWLVGPSQVCPDDFGWSGGVEDALEAQAAIVFNFHTLNPRTGEEEDGPRQDEGQEHGNAPQNHPPTSPRTCAPHLVGRVVMATRVYPAPGREAEVRFRPC